jgi:hypothetical protein
VNIYKNKVSDFTDYTKQNLLPTIFKIIEEPYAYVDPKAQKKNNDQKDYLDTNNLPF